MMAFTVPPLVVATGTTTIVVCVGNGDGVGVGDAIGDGKPGVVTITIGVEAGTWGVAAPVDVVPGATTTAPVEAEETPAANVRPVPDPLTLIRDGTRTLAWGVPSPVTVS